MRIYSVYIAEITIYLFITKKMKNTMVKQLVGSLCLNYLFFYQRKSCKRLKIFF